MFYCSKCINGLNPITRSKDKESESSNKGIFICLYSIKLYFMLYVKHSYVCEWWETGPFFHLSCFALLTFRCTDNWKCCCIVLKKEKNWTFIFSLSLLWPENVVENLKKCRKGFWKHWNKKHTVIFVEQGVKLVYSFPLCKNTKNPLSPNPQHAGLWTHLPDYCFINNLLKFLIKKHNIFIIFFKPISISMENTGGCGHKRQSKTEHGSQNEC